MARNKPSILAVCDDVGGAARLFCMMLEKEIGLTVNKREFTLLMREEIDDWDTQNVTCIVVLSEFTLELHEDKEFKEEEALRKIHTSLHSLFPEVPIIWHHEADDPEFYFRDDRWKNVTWAGISSLDRFLDLIHKAVD